MGYANVLKFNSIRERKNMDQYIPKQDPKLLAEALKKQAQQYGIPEDQNHWYNPDATGFIGRGIYSKYYQQYVENEQANGRQPLSSDQWAKIMSAQQHNQIYQQPVQQDQDLGY